jgi:hypothetical protein
MLTPVATETTDGSTWGNRRSSYYGSTHSPPLQMMAARYLPESEQMETAAAPHTTATLEAARPR